MNESKKTTGRDGGGQPKKKSNKKKASGPVAFAALRAPSPVVDIGCNLTHRDFAADLPAVLERAAAANVDRILITGTSVKSSKGAAAMAARKDVPVKLYFTAGVHPHDAKTWTDETAKTLRTLASSPLCVALGECGIDFDRNFSPPDVQKAVFAKQLALAVDLKMPVFLHQRLGFKEFNEILEHEYLSKPGMVPEMACVHCFTGSAEELRSYVARGLMIGITGFVADEKRAVALRDALRQNILPLKQLLIETDGPFMSPKLASLRLPRRCEPSMLSYVARELADLMQVDFDTLCRQTTANAQRFFSKMG